MHINDCHCHFFSERFFDVLAGERGTEHPNEERRQIADILGWDAPGPPAELAKRWVQELDRHHVNRAALIGSVPGDQESVAVALAEHPERFVGFFMVDPTQEGAAGSVQRAIMKLGLRCVCLFPAMHHYRVYDDKALKIFEIVASLKGAVFVHCGVLSIGVRGKLGLPSRFAMDLSNPLCLHPVALSYPELPIIIPHFGAGFLREALMVADLCPNIYLDTSSSNGWIKYHRSLTLEDVFRQVLDVLGADRLLFGTDSSFFPRGWQRPVWESQMEIVEKIGLDDSEKEKIFFANFDRLFPAG
jgi:uncharacterized protein